MRINLLLFILLFLSVSARAAVDTVKVPLQRQLFHDRINEEQLQLDKIDGKADGQIRATHAVDINQIIADVMRRKVN